MSKKIGITKMAISPGREGTQPLNLGHKNPSSIPTLMMLENVRSQS